MKKSRGKKSKKTELAVTETPIRKSSNGIPFETFFAGCVSRGRLKYWQRDEVLAFFRDLRLREKEEQEVFEDALTRY